MQTVSLIKDGKAYDFEIPESWNEIKREQLPDFISAGFTDNITTAKIQALLMLLTDYAQGKFPTQWLYDVDHEDMALALDCVNFLFDTNLLTNTPLVKMKLAGTEILGPADNFDNMTVGRFEAAGVHFTLFKTNHDYTHLDDFILELLSFSPGMEKSQCLELVRKIDIKMKLALYTWFAGCINAAMQIPEIAAVYEDNGGEPGEVNLAAFTICIHGAAGPRNGLREQIRQQNIKEFLFDIGLQMIDAERQAEELEKMKHA